MADSGDHRKRLAGSSRAGSEQSQALVPRDAPTHEGERTVLGTQREMQSMLERHRKADFDSGHKEGYSSGMRDSSNLFQGDIFTIQYQLSEAQNRIKDMEAQILRRADEAVVREVTLRKEKDELAAKVHSLEVAINLLQSRPEASAQVHGASSSAPPPRIPKMPQQFSDLISKSFTEYKKLWYLNDRGVKVLSKMKLLEGTGALPHSLKIKAPKLTIKDQVLQSELSDKFQDLQNEVNRKFFAIYLEQLDKMSSKNAEKLTACEDSFQEVLTNLCDSLRPTFDRAAVDSWFTSSMSQFKEKCNLFVVDRQTNQNLKDAAENARRTATDEAMREAEELPVEPSVAEIVRREVARGIETFRKELSRPSQNQQRQRRRPQKSNQSQRPKSQPQKNARSSKNLRRQGALNQKKTSTSSAASRSQSKPPPRNSQSKAPAVQSARRQQRSAQPSSDRPAAKQSTQARGRSQVRKTPPSTRSQTNSARKRQTGTRIADTE